MFKLGITGGIGSGKSTATKYFLNKGAFIFDADVESKKYLLSNIELQKRIIDKFGSKITSNSKLDLLKLSKCIFSNKTLQENLNQILWPEIFKLITISYDKANKNNYDYFIVDAALLIEANFIDFFDSTLLITAYKKIRLNRLKNRNDIPFDQIEKRMDMQMSEKEKEKFVTDIISNNDSIEKFYIKLENYWLKLNQKL